MHIIGINGFKRSGKGETHLAIEDVLAGEQFGFRVAKGVGFADKLKIMAAKALGIERANDQMLIAYMDEFKEKGIIGVHMNLSPLRQSSDLLHQTIYADRVTTITGRQYLQNFGNDARQIFGEDFWVDQVLPSPALNAPFVDLERRYPGVDCLNLTDLRYANEAQRIHDLGGLNVEVIRPGLESDGHASEQPLPRHLIDYQIVNDGSLTDLHWKVEKMLEMLPS